MRSSTSGSDVRRPIWVLLAGCLAVALAVEVTARLAFDRGSKIQRRMADEYRTARTIGTGASDGRTRVLFVGNSLLDEDVRFDRLHDAVAAHWDARRFVVEQTFYYDWYYALKRLYREGARPDVVVLMLSTRQWLRTETRGDYSAYYLMGTRDLPEAVRDLNLNATQAANLAFANVSKFWGARAEMRNFLIGHVMPDLGRLMAFSSTADTTPLVDDAVELDARERIARLNALVSAYGGRLLIVLPVLAEPRDGSAGFMRAAQAQHVSTLRPVPSGTFGLHLYRDAGFHLNPEGAAAFTDQLIPALRRAAAPDPAPQAVTPPPSVGPAPASPQDYGRGVS
jgi:hypothetical protein